MNAEQQKGQLACIDAVGRVLLDLERSVIITGTGAPELGEISTQLTRLLIKTRKAKVKGGGK